METTVEAEWQPAPRMVALCGFFGHNNLGDDLMAHHLVRRLSLDGRCQVQLYSDCAAGNVYNGVATPTHLNADCIVIGGGGIVSAHFWVFANGGIDALLASGKPVVFLNINVTPDSFTDATLTAKLKQLGATWWVRDHASVALLASHHIAASYLPDITFGEGVIGERIVRADSARRLDVFANMYGFKSLFSHTDVTEFLRDHVKLRTLAAFLDWMAYFGWEIRLRAAQTQGAFDDRILACALYATMRNRDTVWWDNEALSVERNIEAIRRSDLVLSMRFHTTAIAAQCGVPVVDLTHHDKSRALLTDLSLLPCSVNAHAFTQDDLIRAVQFAENSANQADALAAYRASAQTRWTDFASAWALVLDTLGVIAS